MDNRGGNALVTSSANNGNPPPSGNIDTAGRSWGLHETFAGSGFNASRPLSAPLAVGQAILVDVELGGTPGNKVLALSDGNQIRFHLRHFDGDAYYKVTGTTTQDTGIPHNFNGLHLEFRLTSATTMSVSITPSGGTSSTFSDDLFPQGNEINNIIITGTSDGLLSNAAFINNISVVPEPSAYGAATAIALLLGVCWRRLRGIKHTAI